MSSATSNFKGNDIRTSQRRGNGFRSLSDVEHRSKLEHELCFKCNEKFTRGHHCKKEQLKVFVYAKEKDGEKELKEPPNAKLAILEGIQIELSLC